VTYSNERPGAGGYGAGDRCGDDSAPDSTYLHRKSWSRALIDKATRPIERYGSPEWCALPLDHPNRVAAVILAAESWAWDWENLEDNVRREVEDLRAAFKRDEDAEYVRQYTEHRSAWQKKRVVSISFEERRRQQLEDAKPRPGDFPGRNDGGAA
jgi:pimeloyl-ACP methyl ester carboxylesterase